MSFRRFHAIFRKEAIHIARDWRSLGMALAVPVLLLVLFGYALSLDVDRIPTIIDDRDKTPLSRELADRFIGSRYFTVVATASSSRDIDRGINEDRALLAVVIPNGFSKTIASKQAAEVQLILDGSDSNTASIASGYAQFLVQSYSAELRSRELKRLGIGELRNALEPRVRVVYNNELRSRNFIIPGLIAVILMIIAALLTSLTIAREWENGTMEQLLSTPVRPLELLLGKLCAYFVLGMIDMVIALVIGLGVFHVPMRGSPVLLVSGAALFLFGALCWGIFLSTVTRSQLLAFQASLLSSFLPAFLLSGFVYAIDNMPVVIQQVTRIVPARYFVSILKGIFLKGVGIETLWPQFLFLGAYAAIVFALAVRMMRAKIA
jgi:ABC-2 type transport system permease protein